MLIFFYLIACALPLYCIAYAKSKTWKLQYYRIKKFGLINTQYNLDRHTTHTFLHPYRPCQISSYLLIIPLHNSDILRHLSQIVPYMPPTHGYPGGEATRHDHRIRAFHFKRISFEVGPSSQLSGGHRSGGEPTLRHNPKKIRIVPK